MFTDKKNEEANHKRPILRRYGLPMAIVATGALISISIISSYTVVGGGKDATVFDAALFTFTPGNLNNARPLEDRDHILGNPNAPVKIIEFSDFECPYCKVLHTSMWKVMETYGKTGRVAWIYRHLPIDSIHTKARIEAVASECAAELGGNSAFWDYADRIFELTPSNDGLDLALLPLIAEEIGLSRAPFEECLKSGKYDDHIEADIRDALASGANATPYSIIIAPGKEPLAFTGAQSYATIVSLMNLIDL